MKHIYNDYEEVIIVKKKSNLLLTEFKDAIRTNDFPAIQQVLFKLMEETKKQQETLQQRIIQNA